MIAIPSDDDSDLNAILTEPTTGKFSHHLSRVQYGDPIPGMLDFRLSKGFLSVTWNLEVANTGLRSGDSLWVSFFDKEGGGQRFPKLCVQYAISQDLGLDEHDSWSGSTVACVTFRYRIEHQKTLWCK